jgi:hypothetical protein
MVLFKATTDNGTVGWGGAEFPIVNGMVDVPDEAAEDMRNHGMEVVVSPVALPATAPSKKKKG